MCIVPNENHIVIWNKRPACFASKDSPFTKNECYIIRIVHSQTLKYKLIKLKTKNTIEYGERFAYSLLDIEFRLDWSVGFTQTPPRNLNKWRFFWHFWENFHKHLQLWIEWHGTFYLNASWRKIIRRTIILNLFSLLPSVYIFHAFALSHMTFAFDISCIHSLIFQIDPISFQE